MGIGSSILLIAVGAIMRFAISIQTTGFNIHTVGVILLIVGIVGLVLSLVFWSSWGGFSGRRSTTRVSRRVSTDAYGRTVEPGSTYVEQEERRL
jgi:hypothetical protein